MIDITVTDTEFRIKGHAGYAECGKDIVCAGVSAITQALLNWCVQRKDGADQFKYTVKDGDIRLIFIPGVGCRNLWEGASDMAYLGYRAIEEEYPQYVRVRYIDVRE